MQNFMTPPDLKVIHNYGDNTFGFTCIDITTEHDQQRDCRLNAFPCILETTHRKGKSIEIGFSIMSIGISTKFRYGSDSYEIWNI